MAAPSTGLEEAANIASEFIYSIDNLPHEVSHLLQEIKHRDARTQELQQEIDNNSAKYIRHSLRASASSTSAESPGPNVPSPKSSLLPGKISAAYAEIQDLATEKQLLAQRLVEVISRTRSRLDIDLNKVRVLSGDTADYSATNVKPLTTTPTSILDAFGSLGRNPVLAITENLRSALTSIATPEARSAPSSPASSASVSAVAGSTSTKRRRVTAAPSIKVPAANTWASRKRSSSPTVQATPSHSTHQRSRLSRQIHPPAEEDNDDMDADGDEDADGEGEEGDNEDDQLYCFCRKQSYGDMIACDNEGECPYEWFHVACVNIKGPAPEKWYCDFCKAKGAGAPSTSNRKGRKK